MLEYGGLERDRVEPVRVARNRDQPRLGEHEALERHDVGRPFDQHDVAWVEQRVAQQIERLRGAGRDDDLAGLDGNVEIRHALDDRRSQPGATFRQPVLERRGRLFVGQRLRERGANPRHVEPDGVHEPGAERHDSWTAEN